MKLIGVSSKVSSEVEQYYQRWLKPYSWTTRSLLATTAFSLFSRVSVKSIETFCLLYGYPRSGGSLLGSLIDAHPSAVIANEYNALGRFTGKLKLPKRLYLYDILRSANNQRRAGRFGYKAGGGTYSYDSPAIPNEKKTGVSVLGVAKAGVTTHNLHRHPDRLNNLKGCYRLPVTGFCIVRNPFDLIATIHASAVARSPNLQVDDRISKTFLEFIQLRSDILNWFTQVESIQHSNLFHHHQMVYLEDLIEDPKPILRNVFKNLNLEIDTEASEAISSIVCPKRHRSSEEIYWDSEAIDVVKKIIDQNSHLNRYIEDVPPS